MSNELGRQIRQLWITRFDFLEGALPGRMNPSDIDQVVERRGHFLFIEAKRPRQPMTRGQEILFDNLIALSTPERTVRLLVVTGHPPDDMHSYHWWGGEEHKADVHEIRELVRRWYEWADRQK